MPKIRFDYFDAFERLTEFACKEAKMLVDIVREYDPDAVHDQLTVMHALEHGADQENHQIYLHLASEFVTPIEREDIVSMAQYLDDICDYIEDVIQRFYMFDINEMHPRALEMAELIEKACIALAAAMKDFRNFKKSKELNRLLISVNDFEEEADNIYIESIHDLYANHKDDPIYVQAWNNTFTRMEACADSCENTATAMSTIIMKNS
ncbi:MAG: DUF47 family protein [Coriobacteriales bacterium]|jgi:uncharacterized protein Yka (UPF0111/DUF47 family)|nr:DUF47 family protein [Coriobacteriales bacterium]